MKFLKALKWHAFLKGLMYIAVGVVALVLPDTMVETLGYLIGIILVVIGLISMLSYLVRDPLQNYYHDDFLYGLGEILLGVLMLFHVDLIIKLVPMLLGVLVLVSGFAKLQDVIDMKRLNYDSWIFMLILAVINLAAGVLLIANPFEAAELFFKILGIGLVFSGVTDCISVIFFAAKLRKLKGAQGKDAVTATAVEILEQPEASGTREAEDAAKSGAQNETAGENTGNGIPADNDSEGEIL